MRRMILTMAAFTFVGCVRTHANEATGEVDVDIESPTKKGEDWNGSLSPRVARRSPVISPRWWPTARPT